MNFMSDMAHRNNELADTSLSAPTVKLVITSGQGAPDLSAAVPIGRTGISTENAPLLTEAPVALGALKPLPAPPPDKTRGLISTITSCGGHAILVFALLYAIGAAGKLDSPADRPIEVDIVEEASAEATPQPAQMAPESPEDSPELEIQVQKMTPTETTVAEPPSDTPPPAQRGGQTEPPPAAAQELQEVAEVIPHDETPPERPIPPALEVEAPQETLLQAEAPPALAYDPPPALSPQPALPVPAPSISQPRPTPDAQAARTRALEQRERAERERERRQAARDQANEAAQERAQRQRAIARRQQAQAAASRAAPPPSAPARAARPVGNDGYAQVVASRMRRFAPSSRSIAGTSGTVVVRLSISPSGALASIGVSQSSGSPALDRAALATVRAAAPFPPPPNGGTRNFVQRIAIR